MGDKLNQLEMENAWLRGTVEGLRVDLDKQIDSDLREHLVFMASREMRRHGKNQRKGWRNG